MKHLANLLAIPTVICFVMLFIWGEPIREFNVILYFLMFAVVGVGYVAIMIQNNRDHDHRLAENAVAQFKKEHGITD